VAPPQSVALIGTGLIGGSIGLALRRDGVAVRGFDHDAGRAEAARALGAVDALTDRVADAVAGADLTVVAVPVGHVAEVVVEALDAGAALVTDVGSVKASVVAAVEAARPDLAPRFVGGHPMAGSEQEGLAGADADLFVGATWVLTPTGRTDPRVFAEVRSWVRSRSRSRPSCTTRWSRW
jgi:prephenate dehydrogenase